MHLLWTNENTHKQIRLSMNNYFGDYTFRQSPNAFACLFGLQPNYKRESENSRGDEDEVAQIYTNKTCYMKVFQKDSRCVHWLTWMKLRKEKLYWRCPFLWVRKKIEITVTEFVVISQRPHQHTIHLLFAHTILKSYHFPHIFSLEVVLSSGLQLQAGNLNLRWQAGAHACKQSAHWTPNDFFKKILLTLLKVTFVFLRIAEKSTWSSGDPCSPSVHTHPMLKSTKHTCVLLELLQKPSIFYDRCI